MWTEPILHVDMDSFFVEVERLRDDRLRGRPVAVGGTGKRGVIASASYEARAYGVHSAQPTSVARRLCPSLVVVSPNHASYQSVSEEVFATFRTFTPRVESLSLDEGFLDVSGLRRHYDSPFEVARAIRSAIATHPGLPSSVGVAASKFVAKLASKEAKPNGLLHVPLKDQAVFLNRLPVEALWGVGPATLAGLKRLGVVTVRDLVDIPEGTVTATLGPATGRHLIDLANGIDPRGVVSDVASKSVSVEETFPTDMKGRDGLEAVLLGQSQRLSARLRRAGLAATTVSVKIRWQDFTTTTRATTLTGPINAPKDLFETARELLRAVSLLMPVRLLGIGASSLVGAGTPRQLSIDSSEQWARIADAVAGIDEKFGEGSVAPARLLDMPAARPESDL